MSDSTNKQTHKSYKGPRAGVKADKKDVKEKKKLGLSNERHNSKAFAFSNGIAQSGKLRHSLDLAQKRLHVKIENRTYGEPPPKLVAVVGPPQSGKTTLIKSLVKHYTKNRLSEVTGPITVKTGKTRQTFFECPNDLNAMIDISKVADLVVLVIDASYGFEMVRFSYLVLVVVVEFFRFFQIWERSENFFSFLFFSWTHTFFLWWLLSSSFVTIFVVAVVGNDDCLWCTINRNLLNF